jgi:serine/threonine protein kinase
MNSSTQTCDQLRLEQFLLGDLSGEAELELTVHLDECLTCRDHLERLAAEPTSWDEAAGLLKTQDFDQGVVVAGQTSKSLQVQQVLDSLAPTDDPMMLGRLGDHEVSGVVGVGAMGVVLKALDRSLDRIVAIKVLAPHLATSGSARKRFAREAKAAAAVLHPNVMAIHSVSNDESLPYLVMPYMRGASLQRRLDDEGPLPVSEVLRIGSQIAAGLAAAHSQGLVHRDIKPANILLEEGVERVAITDFGLARAVDDATMTRVGFIAGTPQFMSPEQARGDSVDQRSDLFSLGSVMYTMCAGRPPFRAETSYGVMRRITDTEPRPIREVNPEIPEWLFWIVDRLMCKLPGDRFDSADEVAEVLEECLAHVQQPTVASLPDSLTQSSRRRFSFLNFRYSGVVTMLSLPAVVLCWMMFMESSEPPDIAGEWNGGKWGTIVLNSKKSGSYEGTLENSLHTAGKLPDGHADILSRIPHFQKSQDNAVQCSHCHLGQIGTIDLKWSRLERRYNGTWSLATDPVHPDQRAAGKLSLEFVGEEIHGGWTTKKRSAVDRGTPRLSSLIWKKAVAKADTNDGNNILQPSIESLPTVFDLDHNCPRIGPPEPLAILRSLEAKRGLESGALCSIHDANKSSVSIVVEPVYDKRLPVRHYPGVGVASLHLLRHRCTVYFTVTLGVEWPLTKDGTPELETTFYMDSDHLHRMEGNEKAVLR